MPGGYLQLKTKGIEDTFFTVKPDISYFRYCFSKYCNFFKFPIETSFANSDRKDAFFNTQIYKSKIEVYGD